LSSIPDKIEKSKTFLTFFFLLHHIHRVFFSPVVFFFEIFIVSFFGFWKTKDSLLGDNMAKKSSVNTVMGKFYLLIVFDLWVVARYFFDFVHSIVFFWVGLPKRKFFCRDKHIGFFPRDMELWGYVVGSWGTNKLPIVVEGNSPKKHLADGVFYMRTHKFRYDYKWNLMFLKKHNHIIGFFYRLLRERHREPFSCFFCSQKYIFQGSTSRTDQNIIRVFHTINSILYNLLGIFDDFIAKFFYLYYHQWNDKFFVGMVWHLLRYKIIDFYKIIHEHSDFWLDGFDINQEDFKIFHKFHRIVYVVGSHDIYQGFEGNINQISRTDIIFYLHQDSGELIAESFVHSEGINTNNTQREYRYWKRPMRWW